jgi:Tol biopolymer transport system component
VSTIPERLSAALTDRYRIERELGQGGMATVYLALDLKHDRNVALKVLKPELAAVLGAERFLAEIKTTANLQHPHILPLHDSGEVDGTVFYVMPYVQGETLRDRLAREKQLPIADAVRLGGEVAGALDYAHRQGIIHRDIKPENILLHDGRALVADFGIALAASRTDGGTRMTETGMSLGTPHYMSPEQAMGERTIDARTDIYALGCVLYEMLTGEPPHSGPTAQAIVAKVLTDEPRPLVQLRKSVPGHVEDAVLTALAKLPADRFSSAAEFAAALEGTGTVTRMRATAGRASTASSSRRHQAILAGAVMVASLVGWSGHAMLRSPPAPDVVRLTLPVLEGITGFAEFRNLALSRDAKVLAYVSEGTLKIRRLDRAETIVVPGTDGAYNPFFSPEGSKVGFERRGNLYWTTVDGGAVTPISGAQISYRGIASWDQKNRVVYEAAAGIGGLRRIAVGGGDPEQLTTVAAGESYHMWPQAIGDGRLVLFTLLGPSGQWRDAKIILLDTESGERVVVREHATSGQYLPTGHVLFVEETGALAALPFDLTSRKATGEPFAVESGVRVSAWGGGAMYAAADDGTLAIVRGVALEDERLWWLDRSGRQIESIGPATIGFHTKLSDDGRTIVTVTHRVGDQGISLIDTKTGQAELFTLEPESQWAPVWSPDSRKIAFAESGPEGSRVVVREIEGAQKPVEVYTSPRGREIWAEDWSADGLWILLTENAPNGASVMAIRADGTGTPVVLATTAVESGRRFSPSGRWVVYQSREDVYVVSFPDPKRRFQIGKGSAAIWSRDGREILFWRADTLFTLPFLAGEIRGPESPRPLFTMTRAPVSFENGYDYDVSPNGQRILLRMQNVDAYARGIDVVMNWFTMLRTRPQGGKQ